MEVQKRNHLLEAVLFFHRQIDDMEFQQIMNQDIDNDKRQEIIERNKKINNHFNNLEDKLFKQETLSKEEIVFFNELEIGRASCRERVYISVVDKAVKKKKREEETRDKTKQIVYGCRVAHNCNET